MSLLRVATRKIPVSRARFEAMVSHDAYRLWEQNIGRRRHRDWYHAHSEFALASVDPIWSNDPRYVRVKIRAEQLYEERKTADALEDWFSAEQVLAVGYLITN